MSDAPIKILLQTTIETTEDDWSISRFGCLAELLRSAVGNDGESLYEVTTRDRGPLEVPDPVLSTLDQSDFDQLWLFAVDSGDGLKPEDCQGITRFRQRGGRLLVTRDHMDLGSSVCALGGVGAAHYFHTRNPNPNPSVCVPDDPFTTAISWPNFHSGANGDFQTVEPVPPIHPVLRNETSPGGIIHFLPSHPHEGGIRAPDNANARVILKGRSKITGRAFDIAVAFEDGPHGGRAIAQSTFHHFADYNWDTRAGCPSFVAEPPGNGLRRDPRAWADTQAYVLNLAAWFGASPSPVTCREGAIVSSPA